MPVLPADGGAASCKSRSLHGKTSSGFRGNHRARVHKRCSAPGALQRTVPAPAETDGSSQPYGPTIPSRVSRVVGVVTKAVTGSVGVLDHARSHVLGGFHFLPFQSGQPATREPEDSDEAAVADTAPDAQPRVKKSARSQTDEVRRPGRSGVSWQLVYLSYSRCSTSCSMGGFVTPAVLSTKSAQGAVLASQAVQLFRHPGALRGNPSVSC
jgi:hypothetical protein